MIPLFGQEPLELFRLQSLSPERPLPQLTPSGNSLVNRPASTPTATFPLPSLEKAPIPLPVKQEELDRVIQEGEILEAEAHWTEVLSYYETALRFYRNEHALMDRYRVARFHCDIGRRFHDASYLNLIRSLSVIETLNFYEEVMTQIQQNYAEIPRWELCFQHGIQNFCIAMTDKNFRSQANVNIPDEQVNTYLSSVQATVNGWKIRDREDMKNGLLHIAEGAQKQLGLNPVFVMMEFTCGVVNSLDPHTAYLTPNQLNDQLAATSGNLVGLGVDLRSDRDSLLIFRVLPGSPAEESGLKERDRILAVDGISTRGRDLDNAADLLQGNEGSSVLLSILSEGLGQLPRDMRITRRQIDVPSVEDVRMITDTLGYVKLTSFHAKTRWELTKALTHLDTMGMKCLILDMRQNPGGLFQVGIEVASMFIEQGAIVRTQGRDRELDAPYMAQGDTWQVPLIVLIDGESASSAEIVAGAIRDHHRGILIGKQSYGKGTIQQIVPVRSGTTGSVRSGVKLTVEKFYSPLGWPYSGIGVTPHILVSDGEKQRMTLAKPFEGRLPSMLARPATSSLDDPYIQKAVEVSKTL